jgi:membrane protein CcdC involved in cytochrome C biogenesis
MVLAFLAMLAVAMAGLLIRALMIGEFAGVLFILGFAALFAWQVGGFVRRNQPRSYSFDRLPAGLLP